MKGKYRPTLEKNSKNALLSMKHSFLKQWFIREIEQWPRRWQRECCMYTHTFLYISLPSLHDCDVKMPNFTFYGGAGGGGAWTSDDKFFFLFFNLSAVPNKSTPGEWIYLHLTFSTDWNNHNKVLKNAKFILKVMFSLPWPSSILQLSINWKKTCQEKRCKFAIWVDFFSWFILS